MGEKMQWQQVSVSVCTSRSGTYVEQLDYFDGARAVSEAMMGDGTHSHIRRRSAARDRQCDRGAWHQTTT
jgi:hypothetical protein